MIHSIHEKYDVRDRMYIQSSELMYYQLYYDDQSVGTDSWGEPVAQSFNHNGTINGTRTVYNWDHTTMPSNAGMEGALLYGYQYDRLNRLLRADAIVEDYVATQSGSNLYNCYGIGDVNVNYDPVGNIRQILRTLPETYAMGTLQLQHLNFAVGSTHNRVSEVTDLFTGPRVFTYDVNGNLISDSKNGVLQTDIGRSSYPYQLKGIHPATSESIQYTYLYDTDDSRIFKRVEKGSALQMEYYLKDIGVYNMTSDKWTYFVQGDDRIARVFPQNYQSPGQNAANTDLKVSQGMANFYEYDHLGNTRIVYSVRDIHNGTTNFDIHFAADFFPYGKTLRYFETAAFEEKFLTTQHERDRETGFDYRGARYYDADLGRFLSLDPLAAQFPSWSAYNYVFGNPISLIDPDGRAPQDWVLKDNGTIYWDNNANDQASTKEGETYLGKELTFVFNSYIDGEIFDLPGGGIVEGDKLTSTITLTASENQDGELTGVVAQMEYLIGSTPVGEARNYYPGKGGSNQRREFSVTKNEDGSFNNFSLVYEQHASVPEIEETGLNYTGFKIVDVAQKLVIKQHGNHLWYGSSTNIFPSATLSVNGHELMKYTQPSFLHTHKAPVKFLPVPPFIFDDLSPYPSRFYRRN